MPKNVGRPREFPGRISVHLPTGELDLIKSWADREDRPLSWVARKLIVEALAARQRKAGAAR